MPGYFRRWRKMRGPYRYWGRSLERAAKMRRLRRFVKRHPGAGQYTPRYFKIKDGPTTLTSDGSGVIVGQWTDNPSGYTDWTSIGSLFDSYRVCAIKIQYFPRRPNEEVATTTWEPIYVVGDVDNNTASTTITTVDSAIQYENVKIFNLYRPWTYYMRIPKRTSIPGGGVVLSGGYIDIADAAAFGAIMFRAEGLTLSTAYGTIVGTAYLKAKNRR